MNQHGEVTQNILEAVIHIDTGIYHGVFVEDSNRGKCDSISTAPSFLKLCRVSTDAVGV